MSAFLSDLARNVERADWIDWLPGVMAVVLASTALLVLVTREAARGALTPEREQRAAALGPVVLPLVLAVVLALGSRLLELLT